LRIKFLLLVLAIIFLNVTGCESIGSRSENSRVGMTLESRSEIVFYGVLSLPFSGNYESIWIEDGPIIITPGESPVAYRVISKDEIEFIGSNKSPYDFFKSSFGGSADEIEKSFIEGLGNVTSKSHHHGNGVEYHLIQIEENTKLYITSSSIDFAVEVSVKNTLSELIKNIINKTHLK